MDLDGIIRELINEHKKLERVIRALEEQGPGTETQRKGRRGRKSMDSAARLEVSERMKQYWAKKRQDEANPPEREFLARAASTAA
jgi:RNA polymerase-interacting CarD/CdnL/TRCF family regulator